MRSGAGWGAGETIVDTPFNEENPDTDGVSVVYDADRGTGPDIYFQPLSGGTETQLQLAGQQVNPYISSGVIAFESRATDGDPADIYVYVMATNTLLQVTNSPTVDDTLKDVTVACCQIPFQVNSGYLLLPLRVSSN